MLSWAADDDASTSNGSAIRLRGALAKEVHCDRRACCESCRIKLARAHTLSPGGLSEILHLGRPGNLPPFDSVACHQHCILPTRQVYFEFFFLLTLPPDVLSDLVESDVLDDVSLVVDVESELFELFELPPSAFLSFLEDASFSAFSAFL